MVPNQITFPYVSAHTSQLTLFLPIIPRALIDFLVDRRQRDDRAESAKRLNMALVHFKFPLLFLKKQGIKLIS